MPWTGKDIQIALVGYLLVRVSLHVGSLSRAR